MAKDSFFIDPYGDVRPCNVMDHPFGNIKEKSFQEIWHSPEAEEARRKVELCRCNCWMIGSVGHLMRRHPWKPLAWIIRNKWGSRKDIA
jgi:Fe-coproporphyrin III synthase